MRVEDFDSLIKNKIDQLNEGGYAGMDWSSFEDKLNNIEALTPKENTLFDKQLTSKLTQTTIANKEGMDWSSFANQLDLIPELNPESEVFDATVVDKLTKLNFGYKSSDWENLSNRLDREGLLNNQIIFIKSLELFIFILLIWGIQGFYEPNFTPNNEIQDIPSYQNKEETNPDKKSNDLKVIFADLTQEVHTKTITETNTPPSLIQKNTIIYNNLIPFNTEVLQNAHVLKNNLKATPKETTAIGDKSPPLTNPLGTRKSTNKKYSAVNILPTLLVTLSTPSPLLPTDYKAIRDIKKDSVSADKKKSKFRIGVEFIGKVSSIVSTTNTLGIDYIHHDLSPAYGAGLAMDWRKGNLSFSTGLELTKFTYYTAPLIIYSGPFANNSQVLNNSVTMKMMRIPINLRLDLSYKNNWTAYGKAGLSIHFSVEKSSEIYGQEVINNNAQYTGLKTSETTSIFDKDNHLNENTFASIDLAVGLERIINNRFSFYLEPSYEISLTSSNIKTTIARINSFSFRSGLYYNF